MASTTRVPTAEITGLSGGLLKLMSRTLLGAVPEGAAVMWHYQAVLKDMLGFGRTVEQWDRLDPNLASCAAMAAASRIGCRFCLDLHYFLAHNKGRDDAKAREVPRWRESAACTPVERRVLAYAEAMSRTPPTVTDALSAALLAALGAPALVELTARIAFMHASARGHSALGIQSPACAAAGGLPPLATPSAAGVPAA
jgi:AhpD family alkylhydroperoxidase